MEGGVLSAAAGVVMNEVLLSSLDNYLECRSCCGPGPGPGPAWRRKWDRSRKVEMLGMELLEIKLKLVELILSFKVYKEVELKFYCS